MKTRSSIPTIDPGGVAVRRGAEGEGIVVAVVGSGIDGRHPHFERHENLALPPPLQHYDLTLLRPTGGEPRVPLSFFADGLSKDGFIGRMSKLDSELHNKEALIDRNGFSTHMAAIIAGFIEAADAGEEWPVDEPSMAGIAPKSKLLCLKVLDDEGRGNEVDILRAVELVMALNARAGRIAVHVALVPLSIPHDVANYACGQTPICEAIDRLVESGVVVVVPSGNRGYLKLNSPEGQSEFAGLMSITDPGNAERAITVGATHRLRPKEYGASYFSGRGPTMDGRNKPDLLAPGQRIFSAVPGPITRPTKAKKTSPKRREFTYETKDGTSVAAAHVAGAVAVLLSARAELIGQPDTVKEVLLSTATDLGRPPWFQGRGLLNLSAALGEDARVESEVPIEPKPRQAAAQGSGQIVLSDSAAQPPAPAKEGGKRFAVAFSYPGERREYVEQVVFALREASELSRSDIFYDRFYQPELSRPNLDVYLQDIYRNQSELLVVFLSAEYKNKEWCGLEWRVVRDLIKTRKEYAVMPVRFDDTPIEGLLSIDGYISARKRDPEYIADAILKRLQTNRGLELA